jgi:hypothetical protein
VSLGGESLVVDIVTSLQPPPLPLPLSPSAAAEKDAAAPRLAEVPPTQPVTAADGTWRTFAFGYQPLVLVVESSDDIDAVSASLAFRPDGACPCDEPFCGTSPDASLALAHVPTQGRLRRRLDASIVDATTYSSPMAVGVVVIAAIALCFGGLACLRCCVTQGACFMCSYYHLHFRSRDRTASYNVRAATCRCGCMLLGVVMRALSYVTIDSSVRLLLCAISRGKQKRPIVTRLSSTPSHPRSSVSS